MCERWGEFANSGLGYAFCHCDMNTNAYALSGPGCKHTPKSKSVRLKHVSKTASKW